ncbi:MAG: mechanosensitive ion channel [Thermoleophilia bacterium]|nr:mechanosensitive ion channel [Thermoleophilia bacterium]
MDAFLDLVRDNQTVLGRLATTAVLVALAVALAWPLASVATRRVDDAYARYHLRKVVRVAVFVCALIALAIVWRPFAGRIGVVLGLAAAGVAFAMQEVIGAIAGWFNILLGRIYRVGDRVRIGGVEGDVIDVTPLRTTVMEIGSSEGDSWVRGRQYTGRIVTVSNKATFTEPVFNYSGAFEYIWEELTIPVSYESDWRAAEQIMEEEAVRVSRSEEARRAIESIRRSYPMPRTELEPRVFIRATDNWMELAARFVVPVRVARSLKDDMTRRIRERLDEAGIAIASETVDATVRLARDAREQGDPAPGHDPPRTRR